MNILTETYTIYFWLKDLDGYWKPMEDEFKCNSKSAHKKAEKFIIDKYKGQTIRIKSVVYQ